MYGNRAMVSDASDHQLGGKHGHAADQRSHLATDQLRKQQYFYDIGHSRDRSKDWV